MKNSPADSRTLAVLLLLGVAAASAPVALAAPQVVTVCGRDDAPGGLNLATAIAAGGEIVIRCPAGQQAIELTATRDARGIVHVDGEGKVTLRGPVAGPLFTADISLRLSRLTVENPRTAATANAPGAGAIILGPKASVELDGVTTQNSPGAYVVQSLTAQDSIFQNNGDPAAPGAFAAVISAGAVELRRATFKGNFDHPIAGGSPPVPGAPPLSRRISIEDSAFTGNRSTTLMNDARVSIVRTRFENSGTGPEKWGGAWDCCGGAITLVGADAEIYDSDFRGNAAGGFGGAIYALGSRLRITNCLFEGNKARAGGAVMFWGRRPKVNIWSTGDWPDPPGLELRRTQFQGNNATLFAGGLLLAGAVQADAVLFRANVSAGAGGAIADWRAADLPEPWGGVFDALVAATRPGLADTISLSRPIMTDNIAGTRGAAIAAGSAAVAIGNGLIARNQVKSGSGGAISAAKLTLTNTTLADNPSGGVVAAVAATVRIGNSILLRNEGFNCSLGGSVSDAGHNMQYPGADCGPAVGARDPGLDGQYAPGLISAARGAGDTGMCAANPQVLGVDLYGRPRLQGGHCDVGAIEQPLPPAVASALGLGSGPDAVPRLLWLVFFLVILLFLIGLFWVVLRRRRRFSPA